MQNAMDTVKADIRLGKEAEFVLSSLNSSGFKAYVVGGFVRDLIMGRQTADCDICTSATPEQCADVFENFKVINTGIKHGTVTVIIDSEPIEITTFRTENSYSDGRHPDEVSFVTDIYDDLSRRDFTVNAIAYSPLCGIVDPFDGTNDIKRGIIRCVGDPIERFTEDALRILRALRFSSVLGFDIENETADAILFCKDRLNLISGERIRNELCKLLVGQRCYKILHDFREVISVIIPELSAAFDYSQNNPHHEFDLYTHLTKTVINLPCDPIMRVAGLLHDIAKPAVVSTDTDGISHYYNHAQQSSVMAETIMQRLRFSKAETDLVNTLIRHHDGVIEESEPAIKRKLGRLGADCFFKLLDLQRADNASQTSNVDLRREHNSNLRKIAEKVISDNDCVKVNELAINGNDLIALGLKGRQIGRSLSMLLDAVINGEVRNLKRDLINHVKDSIDSLISIKP